ncbi:hypothetical protein KUTeg_022534 [Tegillarca granosa]|uniref:THAP-type domain-containing protein n=1 Tax=Tegillarca granosa TaxID=220873 RepID=A0ABQ9EBY8_TEGGR|nr:hypothetical protein KUTeg_022534 [Tegillarca granosa]
MVYCVAFNCNSTSGQGVSLFTFPKDDRIRKVWVSKIRREGFVPTATSRLCAKHFELEMFVHNPQIMMSAGFKPKSLRLVPDAVPTIFDYSKRSKTKETNETGGKRKKTERQSKAFQKRRKLEVLSDLQQNDENCEIIDSQPAIQPETVACESLLQLATQLDLTHSTSREAESGISIGTDPVEVYHCGIQTKLVVKKVLGSFINVSISCDCGHVEEWSSQPMMNNMPVGNLIIAGAIMFSGCSPVKALNFMNHASIATISARTYHYMQTAYIVPSINSVNKVKNSNAMELEGLKRGLQYLDNENVKVQEIVTDRHSQVKKFMKSDRPNIKHYFDVWHMAKGVNSKLEKKGKIKGCGDVALWARSVSNHMYWCAASSNGNGEVVLEKWLSILNHVVDIHEGHGNKFLECVHDQLEDRVWMKEGPMLLKDIQKLSPAEQTSSLESFHKVVCFFAPKAVHFFYPQMRARLYLAALHFNENSKRQQAVTRDGTPIYGISYPKSRKGAPVAKEVKVKQTFGYVNELMAELLLTREVHPTYKRALAISSLENQGQPSPVAETLFRRPKLDTYDKSSTCIRVNIHTGYLNPQNSSDGKLSLILLTTQEVLKVFIE